MNSFKNIGSLIGSAAMLAAAVGLTAGLAPASAAPQQSPGVTLTIKDDPANPANSVVRIEGTFPISEGDAHDRVNHMTPGGGMDYILYADDPGENDAMIGSPHGYIGMPGPGRRLYDCLAVRHKVSPRIQRAQRRPRRGFRLQ